MKTTKDIKLPAQIVDEVIGQDEAVRIIKKAALQRRHVLLIGEPGTGKSMLGMALAELLPKSELKDLLAIPNPNDENNPSIKEIPAGKGREEVKRYYLDTKQMLKNNNFLLFIVAALTLIAPWWVRHYYKSDLMFTAFFLGGMIFLAVFVMMMSMGPRMFKSEQFNIPKLIVDNFGRKNSPFFDATGAHAGALLGDVLHDPFQSGGLGTPANQRVVAGMIHKANGGVLFVDEIATLHPRTQQELLSALQEKKFSITGQSERSAGAMVRTEAVPCDFIMVAAGNLETVKHMHPALRSRIRGYGYEIYMKETIPDTEENRNKIAIFVAQEVTKDKKIPHFSREAVEAIIEEDVGKTRRDDGAEAVVFQRPGRVFARTAAAEILARQQDLRSLVARLVQHEIRIERALAVVHARLAVIQIAPFVERIRAEAGSFDRLQELLGNDRIGVHVGAIQRHDQPIKLCKLFH